MVSTPLYAGLEGMVINPVIGHLDSQCKGSHSGNPLGQAMFKGELAGVM